MALPSQEYIDNLRRRRASGEILSDGDAAYLKRYDEALNAGDHEPHRISRSRTLDILASLETQRILAAN